MFFLLNLIFISIISYVGIITSITDIKNFKIRNKHLIPGFYLGLGFFILFFIVASYYPEIKSLVHAKLIVANLILSIIFGVIFWQMKIWGAADSKLFILYSFLIPPYFYKNTPGTYFLGSNILINTIFLFSLKLFFDVIKGSNFKFYKESVSSIFKNPRLLFSYLERIVVIELIYMGIISIFNLEYNIYHYMILFFLFNPRNFMKKYIVNNKILDYIFVIVILSKFIFEIYSLDIDYFLRLLRLLVYFIFIYLFFFIIPTEFFSKKINYKKLKEGMILKSDILKFDGVYFQSNKKKKDLLRDENVKISVEKKTKGLTKDEVLKIKKLGKKGLIEDIMIYEHTYFAPYMFAGVILTLLLKGNIIFIFKMLFY